MSRGSTFTLYRAYNNFKIDDESRSKLLENYYSYNKKHDWGGTWGEENLTEEKKAEITKEKERRWREDVPIVMNLDFSPDYDWERSGKTKTLAEFRNRRYTNFVLNDGRFCDELLSWDFCSGFDCLIEHFHLNYCNFKDNSVIIDKGTAKEMLAAIEYLLNGVWDDSIEATMHNPWIKIFANGGNCDSYWKYVYRNSGRGCRKNIFKFSGDGINVVVKIPKAKKDGDEDDLYENELSESDESMEIYFRSAANALRAFLETDDYSYSGETELVLVYSAWG